MKFNKNIISHKSFKALCGIILIAGTTGCKQRPTLYELYEQEGLGDTCVVRFKGSYSKDIKQFGFRQINTQGSKYEYYVSVCRTDEYGEPNPHWDTEINDTIIAGYSPLHLGYTIFRNLSAERRNTGR